MGAMLRKRASRRLIVVAFITAAVVAILTWPGPARANDALGARASFVSGTAGDRTVTVSAAISGTSPASVAVRVEDGAGALVCQDSVTPNPSEYVTDGVSVARLNSASRCGRLSLVWVASGWPVVERSPVELWNSCGWDGAVGRYEYRVQGHAATTTRASVSGSVGPINLPSGVTGSLGHQGGAGAEHRVGPVGLCKGPR